MSPVKLSEIMLERQILSFEVFPPKTEKGIEKMPDTLNHLCVFNPDYISCTYGAGGSNVGMNRKVCDLIRQNGTIPVTHFTLIRNSRERIQEQLQNYLDEGVNHVLALRGDIPLGETTTCGDFTYASELVSFIRKEFGDQFEIAIGASPEGHISSENMESDIKHLKEKQDCGADYIMTQLCWDMEQFKRWLDAIRKAGITLPVDVGVMPVLDQASVINQSLSRNGCVIDRELSRLISKYWIFPNPFVSDVGDGKPYDPLYEEKKEDFKKAGMEYTIRQIEQYKACGVNGIHIYSMNKWQDVSQILLSAGIKPVE